MAKRAQIIPPRSDLRRKAVNRTKGFDLKLTPETLRKLTEVVHRAHDDFTSDISQRLVAMRDILDFVRADDSLEAGRVGLARLYADSLEIKGAGGTIGYDLLTLIGKSLNDFVGRLTVLEETEMRVIELHIDALYVVLANRIKGAGGEIEGEVVDAFRALNAKFAGVRSPT